MKTNVLAVLWGVFFTFLFADISIGGTFQCKFAGTSTVVGRAIIGDRFALGPLRRRASIRCPKTFVPVEGNDLFEAKTNFLRKRCGFRTFISATERSLVVCREDFSGKGETYIGSLRLFSGRIKQPSLAEIRARRNNRNLYDHIFKYYTPVNPEAYKRRPWSLYYKDIDRQK